jgi:hypothetical protein
MLTGITLRGVSVRTLKESVSKGERSMPEITFEVPETLTRLPEQEREMLLRAGLYEAKRARIRQLEAKIAECKDRISRFEARYGMPLARFEREVLAEQDGFQVHADYNDGCYWQHVLEEKRQLLADVQVFDRG